MTPGELYDFVLQEHLAQKAGPHYDFRIGDPEGLYSWAVPKGLPEPGVKHLGVQQPLHEHGYREFEGEIPEGEYGAGTVTKAGEGQVLVTKVTDHSIHFTTASSRYPERFVLFKPQGENWKDQDWLLLNTTPTEALPYEKVRYAKVPAEEMDDVISQMTQGDSIEAKVDGASSLIQLLKDGVEVTSYRTSKTTGRPILHTERFFQGRPESEIPPELVGTTLKGELYGVRGENQDVIPAHELGGILNASIANAIAKQKEQDIRLKDMLFDIQQYGNEPVGEDVPREERRRMMEEVMQYLPEGQFHLSPSATTPEEAAALWEQIGSGEHPLTSEGAIIHPATGRPMKSKFLEDTDVHITNIFPGEGKYEGTGAGGFEYALEPGGETVGRVGTGLSDELRREMWADPEFYVGRPAKIRSQGQFESGAYRAPSFLALHEDWTPPDMEDMTMKAAADTAGLGTTTLAELQAIKALSDAKKYEEKHRELRKLMRAMPDDWEVDSEDGRFYGVTHTPTGFQYHMPRTTVPAAIVARYRVPSVLDEEPPPIELAPPAVPVEPVPLAKAAESIYMNAAKTQGQQMLSGQTPIYDTSKGVLDNVMRHFRSIKQRGDQRIFEADTWDRMLNAMDPNRASRRLQQYLAGTRQPLVSNPVDQFIHERL